MIVLVLNSGSSSVKYQVFNTDKKQVLAKGQVERIGMSGAVLTSYVGVTGLVRERPAGTANAELASGEIEVLCKEVEILNASVTPPFQLDDDLSLVPIASYLVMRTL